MEHKRKLPDIESRESDPPFLSTVIGGLCRSRYGAVSSSERGSCCPTLYNTLVVHKFLSCILRCWSAGIVTPVIIMLRLQLEVVAHFLQYSLFLSIHQKPHYSGWYLLRVFSTGIQSVTHDPLTKIFSHALKTCVLQRERTPNTREMGPIIWPANLCEFHPETRSAAYCCQRIARNNRVQRGSRGFGLEGK